MNQVTLIIDESGAKGYADKQEKFPGELGVLAGYFIPGKYSLMVRRDLDAIRHKYSAAGKMHITDLPTSDQASLRTDIFSYFLNRGIFWAYEAIYTAAMYNNHRWMENHIASIKKSRRSSVVISKNPRPESLHNELFRALFGKSLAFCKEDEGPTSLKIITDKLDAATLNAFKKTGGDFLSFGRVKKVRPVTGFDKISKTIVKGSVTSEIVEGIEAIGDFSNISFTLNSEDSSLTLAADVLANSVYHQLTGLQRTAVGLPINTLNAISGHPLAELVTCMPNRNGPLSPSDTMFRYPQK